MLLASCGEDLPRTAPRQLNGSPFQYPEELWDAEVEGETVLRLYVTERGGVDSVRVERTSGYAEFDTAAVEGARGLQFDPAREGTDSVGVWVLLPVRFELPGNDTTPTDSQ